MPKKEHIEVVARLIGEQVQSMFNKKEERAEALLKLTADQKVNGVGGTPLNEPIPTFNVSASERVWAGGNNVYLVAGRDRPSDIFSGYGGKGVKGAGSLDIVVGRTSANIQEEKDGEKILTDPSIPYDASRILLSQKTDVDDNFYLPNGNVGNRKGKAAIALKSDNLRFAAREGVKIVCNVDRYDSTGEAKIRKFGVDIIANDGADLQPLPKGENLEKVVRDLYERCGQLSSEVANLYRIIVILASTFSVHIHPHPMGFTAPSIEANAIAGSLATEGGMHTAAAQVFQASLETVLLKYLNPASKTYINSLYHRID